MKLTPETYEIIINLLEEAYNSTEDKEEKHKLSEAIAEMDILGTY